MMDGIQGYLITITAAALLCGILQAIIQNKHSLIIIKLLCGIFLTLVLLRPIADLRYHEFALDGLFTSAQAQEIAEEGKNTAYAAIREEMKKQTASYITQKALSYGAELSVNVHICQESTPVPTGIELQGAISPLAKQQLSNWLADEMGIPKEAQIWVN